jgi:DNA-directed RNA polymerase sigma subunit (sigma70/sigma32)
MLPSITQTGGELFNQLSDLKAGLRDLPWVQRRLLQWRLGDFTPPESREAVAFRLGISPERVKQLEISSLLALKQAMAEVNA